MVTLFNIIGLFFVAASIGSCALSSGAFAQSAGMLQLLIGSLFIVAAALINEIRMRIPLPANKEHKPSKFAEFFGA